MAAKTKLNEDELSDTVQLSRKYTFLCFGAGGGDTLKLKPLKAGVLIKFGGLMAVKDPSWVYKAALSPEFLPLTDAEIADLDLMDAAEIVGRFTAFFQQSRLESPS